MPSEDLEKCDKLLVLKLRSSRILNKLFEFMNLFLFIVFFASFLH